MEWLKEDLKNNKQKNGTIVLVHHPHWYVWQNWKPIHDILKEYDTHAVIAGHYHYDQDEGEIDGIRYLVMGSTGGVIKEADKHTSAQEIGILTINPKGVKDVYLYDLDTGEELEWTSRISMDRIQALSCMLDNLWKDESLYKENGRVYAENKEKPISDIDLESLVNPIDLPVRIHISIPENICNDAQWLLDAESLAGDTAIFYPGFRSGWANYSTVGNWYTPNAIWKTEVDDKELYKEGYLELKIHVSFEDTKKRILEKTQTYYLR